MANAQMTEEAAKYANNDTASAVAQANQQYVNQVGGQIVNRAMNVQPTLTVKSGTEVNVMLAKNLYLPPLKSTEVTDKYTR
jgi:type IV secretion system protein VirB10